jgi:DNA-binding response OmpR family regulator
MARVLIIDEEECIREPLAAFAEMLGHEPTVASKPPFCNVYKPTPDYCNRETACSDTLIVDHDLSGLTGLEWIQRQTDFGCKADSSSKIILSTFLSDDLKLQADKLGCRTQQKPVTFETFEKLMIGIETP